MSLKNPFIVLRARRFSRKRRKERRRLKQSMTLMKMIERTKKIAMKNSKTKNQLMILWPFHNLLS